MVLDNNSRQDEPQSNAQLRRNGKGAVDGSFLLYLVSEHSDGGGGADLSGGEPGGGQLGRDPEYEDLTGGHHGLASEGQPPLGGSSAEHLQPRPQARPGRAQQDAQSESLKRKYFYIL